MGDIIAVGAVFDAGRVVLDVTTTAVDQHFFLGGDGDAIGGVGDIEFG